MVEASDRILPPFHECVSEAVRSDYEEKDIDIRTETFVERIKQEKVVLKSGEELRSDLTIWAGGVKPNPTIDEFDMERERGGLTVDAHMRCDGYEDIYAVGDVADYEGKVNRAFFALSEAKTAATNIARDIRGEDDLEEQEIGWEPNVIHLGHNDAIFELNGHCFRGLLPDLMRRWGIEQRYLLTRRYLL